MAIGLDLSGISVTPEMAAPYIAAAAEEQRLQDEIIAYLMTQENPSKTKGGVPLREGETVYWTAQEAGDFLKSQSAAVSMQQLYNQIVLGQWEGDSTTGGPTRIDPQMGEDGLWHDIMVDARTGQPIRDMGPSKTQPQDTAAKQAEADEQRQFQEEQAALDRQHSAEQAELNRQLSRDLAADTDANTFREEAIGPDGNLHTYLFDSQTGAMIADLGVAGMDETSYREAELEETRRWREAQEAEWERQRQFEAEQNAAEAEADRLWREQQLAEAEAQRTWEGQQAAAERAATQQWRSQQEAEWEAQRLWESQQATQQMAWEAQQAEQNRLWQRELVTYETEAEQAEAERQRAWQQTQYEADREADQLWREMQMEEYERNRLWEAEQMEMNRQLQWGQQLGEWATQPRQWIPYWQATEGGTVAPQPGWFSEKTPPTPPWLTQFTGQAAGTPVEARNVKMASPQTLGQMAPSAQQGLGGYLGWTGVPEEDYLKRLGNAWAGVFPAGQTWMTRWGVS